MDTSATSIKSWIQIYSHPDRPPTVVCLHCGASLVHASQDEGPLRSFRAAHKACTDAGMPLEDYLARLHAGS
jgi:hypothetical protein